jgi:hypothetical protein
MMAGRDGDVKLFISPSRFLFILFTTEATEKAQSHTEHKLNSSLLIFNGKNQGSSYQILLRQCCPSNSGLSIIPISVLLHATAVSFYLYQDEKSKKESGLC